MRDASMLVVCEGLTSHGNMSFRQAWEGSLINDAWNWGPHRFRRHDNIYTQ